MSKLILLIDDDDDEMNIFTMAVSMVNEDYEYAYACSVDQAMRFLAGVEPAYIFVDVNMPKTDGLSCVSRIRRLARFDHVPVIVYSTAADDRLLRSAKALGANDCIRKENTLQRLSESIHNVLNKF